MPEQKHKRCGKCRERKPLEAFYKQRRAADGLQPWCKECSAAAKRHWRAANPARGREAERRYETRHPDRKIASSKRHRERNPEKARARKAVQCAVQRGQITKPDACEDCGKSTRADILHAHHNDYAAPLEIAWVCPPCHALRHRTSA